MSGNEQGDTAVLSSGGDDDLFGGSGLPLPPVVSSGRKTGTQTKTNGRRTAAARGAASVPPKPPVQQQQSSPKQQASVTFAPTSPPQSTQQQPQKRRLDINNDDPNSGGNAAFLHHSEMEETTKPTRIDKGKHEMIEEPRHSRTTVNYMDEDNDNFNEDINGNGVEHDGYNDRPHYSTSFQTPPPSQSSYGSSNNRQSYSNPHTGVGLPDGNGDDEMDLLENVNAENISEHQEFIRRPAITNSSRLNSRKRNVSTLYGMGLNGTRASTYGSRSGSGIYPRSQQQQQQYQQPEEEEEYQDDLMQYDDGNNSQNGQNYYNNNNNYNQDEYDMDPNFDGAGAMYDAMQDEDVTPAAFNSQQYTRPSDRFGRQNYGTVNHGGRVSGATQAAARAIAGPAPAKISPIKEQSLLIFDVQSIDSHIHPRDIQAGVVIAQDFDEAQAILEDSLKEQAQQYCLVPIYCYNNMGWVGGKSTMFYVEHDAPIDVEQAVVYLSRTSTGVTVVAVTQRNMARAVAIMEMLCQNNNAGGDMGQITDVRQFSVSTGFIQCVI